MALVKADRVRETTTTTGTGAVSLAGAATGYRAFSTVCADGDTCYYVIVSQTGTEWETGLGTFSTPATFTRTTVHSSSNSGSAVSFTAGTKDIFIALTATQFASISSIDLTSQVTGALPVANGGTGQTTAANAINSLLPTQTSNSGKYLTTNGTASSWATVTSNPGTVTSVSGTGTVNGLSLSGTVTSSGNLTLGGALSGVNLISQVTGTLPVANGGTGTTNGSITGTGVLTFTAATSEGVTISASDHGSVAVDAGADIQLDSGKGYFDNGGSLIALRGVVKAQSATVGNGRSTSATNTVLGTQALDSYLTSSSGFNTAIGNQAMNATTSGQHSTVVGNSALYTVTNPSSCTVVGSAAVPYLTSASGIVAFGASAGQYQSDGTTNLTASINSIYIGRRAYGFNNSDDNTIVIGCETAGKGANTTILGNSSTTQTWLGGGELRLPGSTSGYVGLKGAATAGSTTYTLPSADGTSGQYLKTNGSGTMSWATVTSNPGTVTSVGGTGTVNGITLTGTVTSSGNLTLGGTLSGVDLASQVTGTLPIANGGTGQTTAANAVNALLPTQTSNSGKYLTTNGTASSWAAVAASPAGSSGEFQYNSSGSFAGASKLTIQSSGWPNVNAGFFNCGVGDSVLNALTTGVRNIAFGASACKNTTTGSGNLAIGLGALQNCIVGNENVAIGESSLYTATSSGNTSVGYYSGANNAGGNNTTIGYQAQVAYGGTGANCTVIGYNASSSAANINNQITLGNSLISTLRCQVTSITSLSDRRDKTNIQPMPSVLSFIASLNPVQFDWWMRDGAKIGEPDYGFIAQELQQAQSANGFDWAQLVYESNPEKLEASPGKLIPILVKAIQELAAEVAILKAR